MKKYKISHIATGSVLKENCKGSYSVRPSISHFADRILCSDAIEALRTIPDNSIQTIITSPPYYQQRDYGTGELQIGGEQKPEDYISRLAAVFSEARRVLRTDGLLWLNLGDKFQGGLLLGMPWRVTLALQNSGWMLRSDIIWHKPNAMPHSAKTRPTVDHEYIFMLSKSSEYYYDADAIREPHVTFSDNSKMKGGRNHFGKRGGTPENGKNGGNSNLHNGRWDQAFHPLGRNKRTVWNIPLSKYRGAHFAVFPDALVENCLKASSRPGDYVLDPFAGSGTVAAVAARLQRKFVMIEVSQQYCELIQERLNSTQMELVPAK